MELLPKIQARSYSAAANDLTCCYYPVRHPGSNWGRKEGIDTSDRKGNSEYIVRSKCLQWWWWSKKWNLHPWNSSRQSFLTKLMENGISFIKILKRYYVKIKTTLKSLFQWVNCIDVLNSSSHLYFWRFCFHSILQHPFSNMKCIAGKEISDLVLTCHVSRR